MLLDQLNQASLKKRPESVFVRTHCLRSRLCSAMLVCRWLRLWCRFFGLCVAVLLVEVTLSSSVGVVVTSRGSGFDDHESTGTCDAVSNLAAAYFPTCRCKLLASGAGIEHPGQCCDDLTIALTMTRRIWVSFSYSRPRRFPDPDQRWGLEMLLPYTIHVQNDTCLKPSISLPPSPPAPSAALFSCLSLGQRRAKVRGVPLRPLAAAPRTFLTKCPRRRVAAWSTGCKGKGGSAPPARCSPTYFSRQAPAPLVAA